MGIFGNRHNRWQDQAFCVVDVETTGLYPRSDRVVELGVVRTLGDGTVLSEWSTLVDPARDIGPTHIHGIAAGDVIGAPQFSELIGDILEEVQDSVLVGHNISFDLRFLRAEFERAQTELPEMPSLCTLAFSRELIPGRHSRKLGACCEQIGIAHLDAHAALGDARATAQLLTGYLGIAASEFGMRRLSDITDTPLIWPRVPQVAPSGRRHQRGEGTQRVEAQGTYLMGLVDRLSDAEDQDADTTAYMAVLDLALEDRRLTDMEAQNLAEIAAEWGLGAEQVLQVHDRYFDDLLDAAMADHVITDMERSDLRMVGRLLGIDAQEAERRINTAQNRPSSPPAHTLAGLSVCFTGELEGRLNGERITRAKAQELAEQNGLTVRKGVTKTVDLLVVADPDTQSHKMRKAHGYGVRVMTEPVFWSTIGVSVE